jgi:hypothetical protein
MGSPSARRVCEQIAALSQRYWRAAAIDPFGVGGRACGVSDRAVTGFVPLWSQRLPVKV